MNEIQEWLNNEHRDYITGVALFAKYSKNKSMANNFARGTSRFWMSKLTYELTKLSNLPASSGTRIEVVKSTLHSERISTLHDSGQVTNQTILAAKKEIASLYSIIDKMHKELFDLGTSNADDVVKKRKNILDERMQVILRADKLYLLKEEWFAGNTSVIDEIAKMLSEKIDGNPSVAKSLPEEVNVSSLTDSQLVKRKTQLSSSITKTKNMLDFQSIRKGDVQTPMPDGPKRDEYELKLNQLKKEFTEVAAEIKKRGL